MPISNSLRNKLLDHILGSTLYQSPGSGILRVGLFNNTNGNTSSNLEQGIVIDEISVNGAQDYSREAVTFSNSVNGIISNNLPVTWVRAPNNWGTITHAAVFDGATNEMLFWQELDEPVTINFAERLSLRPGELKVRFDAIVESNLDSLFDLEPVNFTRGRFFDASLQSDSNLTVDYEVIEQVYALSAVTELETIVRVNYSVSLELTSESTVSVDSNFIAIGASEMSATTSLNVFQEQALFVWGEGGQGVLGLGSTTQAQIPTKIGNQNTWTQVSAGSDHTLAVTQFNELFAWGFGASGRLGTGDTNNRTAPTKIGTDNNWAVVVAAQQHSLALKTDGSLWSWGSNNNGVTGLGLTSGSTLVPTRVGTANNWICISAGSAHSLAINSDGELWSWGRGVAGALGLGDEDLRSVPTRVGNESNWVKAIGGGAHSLAINSDGELWSWGTNFLGTLGLGDSGAGTNRVVPTRVGNESNWLEVAAGSSHSLAINSDGELWSWGLNASGQLGLGDSGAGTNRVVPTRVGNDSNWLEVRGGLSHTIALKSNGTIYGWGSNSSFQLGLGNNTSPILAITQIGISNKWININTPIDSSRTFAIKLLN